MKLLPRKLTPGPAMLCLVLVLLTAGFSICLDRFFTYATFQVVLNQLPEVTFVAIGMTFVLIAGGIDLSVGAVMALSSASLGVLLAGRDWPVLAAVPAVLAGGLVLGSLNGLVTTGFRIASFIVTLGMMQVARGLALLMTGSRMQFIGNQLEPLVTSVPRLGVSPAFLLAGFAVITGQFVLSRTVFGRWCIALGANQRALHLSGVRTAVLRVWVFTICGGLAAVAGLVETARLSTGNPGGARGVELLAIAAAVIGGTSLSGGRGSVLRTFLGVLIIAVLQAGLSHAGAGEGTRSLITGLVTVSAVAFDRLRQHHDGDEESD